MFCHGSIERGHGSCTVGTRTHSTELEAVAREGKRTGAVAVGVVDKDFRNLHQSHRCTFLAGNLNRRVGRHFEQLAQHLRHRVAQEGGDDGWWCFIRTQSVSVCRCSDGGFQQGIVFLYSHQHVYKEGDKLKVALCVLSWCKKQGARVGAERPVVVLARTVDACERFFVQQEHKAMLTGNLVHQVHHHLVLVVREVGLTIDGSQLELVGSHLVMASLERNAMTVARYLHILHELHHS